MYSENLLPGIVATANLYIPGCANIQCFVECTQLLKGNGHVLLSAIEMDGEKLPSNIQDCL